MKKIFLLSIILISQIVLAQKSNYNKYQNNIYSFELPKVWTVPIKKVIKEYTEKEKGIAKDNQMNYNSFDFLFSNKHNDTLYFPIIKVTTLRTDKNLFLEMKKQFGSDYIEKEIIVSDESLTFEGRPLVDTKNQKISISMNSEEIFGQTMMFFSNNSIVQFTYTDNKSNKCIECLLLYYNSVNETFKFK